MQAARGRNIGEKAERTRFEGNESQPHTKQTHIETSNTI